MMKTLHHSNRLFEIVYKYVVDSKSHKIISKMIIKNIVGFRNGVRWKPHVIMTKYQVHLTFLEIETDMLALEERTRSLCGD